MPVLVPTDRQGHIEQEVQLFFTHFSGTTHHLTWTPKGWTVTIDNQALTEGQPGTTYRLGANGDAPYRVLYTNYRGETAERFVYPQELWWGATEYHPESQWLLTALEIRNTSTVQRHFALHDIHEIEEALSY
jgi:hypothetical protein